MTQQTQTPQTQELKQHMIWQDGHEPEPCTIVLFGATGDLSQRKILPTLAHLLHDHPTPDNVCIVAFARRDYNDDTWRQLVLSSLDKYMPADDKLDDRAKQVFASQLFYCRSTFDDLDGYKRLGDLLHKLDAKEGTGGNRLFYLATPPDMDATIIEYIGKADLSQPTQAESGKMSWVRIVTEKPFGHDLDSARELNQELGAVFHENQIFRVDHYMGKETVQNIIAFRFTNGIFEPLWNQKYIDHVQITVAESLGIENRSEYYESAGAIRDIVQNHIMQILSLVAMEPPAEYNADDIRNEKVKVLHAIYSLTPEQVKSRVVRGQYTAGTEDGQQVVGYRQEHGVNPDSTTETYVALKLFIENWRWADIPIYIRTGKHLPMRSTEVTIQFKRVPHQLYKPDEIQGLIPNRLTLRIQPDEGISMKVGVKVPGAASKLSTVDMGFSYSDAFHIELPDAYERIFADCIVGDSTLFIRRDEIEESWRIIDSITDAWKQEGGATVYPYAAGTWGPKEADELIQRDGRRWDNP